MNDPDHDEQDDWRTPEQRLLDQEHLRAFGALFEAHTGPGDPTEQMQNLRALARDYIATVADIRDNDPTAEVERKAWISRGRSR
ncbi:hypothetical protein [Rhodococcus sp. 311R]|uniref:hypothetical protein n=1 Tax=Rhodococcus sp. 311R TaxID=1617904 RepID=UPI00067EA3B4|nr:hypothetical protein [Rhodococcus sp. 311R]